MAATSAVDAALSASQRIGRYFTLVSMIPALFLVLWTYMLVTSGAVSGVPRLANVQASLSHWSVAKVAGLLFISLAVAMVIHPLQFATTQLLEGYWGASALAVAAMKVRIVHHRKCERGLYYQAAWNKSRWRDKCLEMLGKEPGTDPEEQDQELKADVGAIMKSESGDPLMLHSIAEQQASNQRASTYPLDPTRILPTRLGNALRSFEDTAGKQYGLDVLIMAPRLHLIATPRHLEYLIDAREDMDSAIRICTVGFVATLLTVGFLLTDGLWLLWAILPYSVSYLAYRGAVSAAQGYGAVIASVIDLNRFRFYDELGLFPPRDTTEERQNNKTLMQILAGEHATVPYKPRSPVATGRLVQRKRGTNS